MYQQEILQTNSNVVRIPAKHQQVDYVTKSYPVTRSEATAAANGDTISGTPAETYAGVSSICFSSGSGTDTWHQHQHLQVFLPEIAL